MAGQRIESPENPVLSRRDFLTGGLRGRIAALLGSGALAASAEAAEGVGRTPGGDLSARDLRKMTREEVRMALRRIHAQRRTP